MEIQNKSLLDSPARTPILKRFRQLKNHSQNIQPFNKLRNSVRTFPSTFIREKKKIMTKEQLMCLTTKIELIKSKCIKSRGKKAESSNAISTCWADNEQFNDSVELESENTIKNIEAKNKIFIINSIFENRPSTVFFKYPPCCGVQNIENSRVYCIDNFQPYYKISGNQYKCVINSLEYNGFKRCEDGKDWIVYFDIAGTHLKTLENMNKFQRINHFPGCWQIGRKDYMYKNLHKQKRSHPQAYNFVPTTFIFPNDYERFQLSRQCAQKGKLWIMKPTNQACGRGIKMVTKETLVKNKKDTLVSEYVSNPHLINNLKYDLRIYVLVTSFDPLAIYMFEQGLTRFATSQYSTRIKTMKKRFVHLTNFSVNKHSQQFIVNRGEAADGQGSKWSISALKRHYLSLGIDVHKLFEDIKDVIIKTCISVEPVMLDIYSKTHDKRNCAFELYGFDILIDSNLKPWLMEVNVCPSLSSSSPLDRKIKHTLLTDILNIIGLEVPEKSKKKHKQKAFNLSGDKKYYSKNINFLENLSYQNCLQLLTPQDLQMLFEFQQQSSRKGHFQCIFPNKNNIDTYKSLFEINRYSNNVLWKHLKSLKKFVCRLYQ